VTTNSHTSEIWRGEMGRRGRRERQRGIWCPRTASSSGETGVKVEGGSGELKLGELVSAVWGAVWSGV